MRDIKPIYKAFLLAPCTLIGISLVFLMVHDGYRVYDGNANLLWYIYRFFRRHIQYFTFMLLLYLPSKKYLNCKPIHAIVTFGLSLLVLIGSLQWQVHNRMDLGKMEHWHWAGLTAWALLILINYTIIHYKTKRVLLSLLFAVNITFVMSVVYELAPVMLSNPLGSQYGFWFLESPFLAAFGCFVLFLFRLEARLNRKLVLVLLFSLAIIAVEWCCWSTILVGSHRFFAYPLGITTALTIPKQNV